MLLTIVEIKQQIIYFPLFDAMKHLWMYSQSVRYLSSALYVKFLLSRVRWQFKSSACSVWLLFFHETCFKVLMGIHLIMVLTHLQKRVHGRHLRCLSSTLSSLIVNYWSSLGKLETYSRCFNDVFIRAYQNADLNLYCCCLGTFLLRYHFPSIEIRV